MLSNEEVHGRIKVLENMVRSLVHELGIDATERWKQRHYAMCRTAKIDPITGMAVDEESSA